MAQTGWSARSGCPAELTTPALLLRLRPIGLALRGATLLCEGEMDLITIIENAKTAVVCDNDSVVKLAFLPET